MSDSFEISDPTCFRASAVGQPGQRTFFLQGSGAGVDVTLKVEKQQVAALCEYLGGILADLPPAATLPAEDHGLPDPAEAQWTVGALAVAYEASDDRILVVAEELAAVDDDLDELVELGLDLEPPATARFHLTRAQVESFIHHGRALVASGRETCPLCQGPIDPAGHACPRLN